MNCIRKECIWSSQFLSLLKLQYFPSFLFYKRFDLKKNKKEGKNKLLKTIEDLSSKVVNNCRNNQIKIGKKQQQQQQSLKQKINFKIQFVLSKRFDENKLTEWKFVSGKQLEGLR